MIGAQFNPQMHLDAKHCAVFMGTSKQLSGFSLSAGEKSIREPPLPHFGGTQAVHVFAAIAVSHFIGRNGCRCVEDAQLFGQNRLLVENWRHSRHVSGRPRALAQKNSWIAAQQACMLVGSCWCGRVIEPEFSQSLIQQKKQYQFLSQRPGESQA